MNTRSILICDDEPELAEEMAEFFQSAGWSVRTANSAADAIRHLEPGPAPTVLMTDLRMPGMSGEALVRHVHNMPQDRQPGWIVIVTGHVCEGMAATEFAADRLFIKPIDPHAVLNELERLAETTPDTPET